MSYTVELLPDLPVVLATFYKGFDFQTGLMPAISEAFQLIEQSEIPVFLIAFLQHQPDLHEMMTASSATTHGEKPIFHHPAIRQVIYVSTSDTIKNYVAGLNLEVFGNLNIGYYDTLDAALDFVRQQD